MMSVLYRVIKKTSRATVSFFVFFNTCSSFSARTESGVKGGFIVFMAIVRCLHRPVYLFFIGVAVLHN